MTTLQWICYVNLANIQAEVLVAPPQSLGGTVSELSKG